MIQLMQSETKSAVVVGAGLVGALWSVFLARRGYQVQVFERRPDMRKAGYAGGRSINLAMSERGWKAVERAGIRSAIERVAIPMPGRMIHDVRGQTAYQPYGKSGQAIYSVSRGGLNLELLQIAGNFPNVQFHFDHRCLEVDLDKPVIAFEHMPSGRQVQLDAPLIFACDGAYSAVRYALQKTDRFNYEQQYLEHGYKELTIPPTQDGGYRMEPNALHIWPRGNFMLIALPNADGSFTCTLFLPFEGEIAFEHLKQNEDIEAFFKRYFPDAAQHMPSLLEDFRRNPTSSLVTVRCSPWQWQNRILLLGDAAHAIVPFYGQGMNAGFEDCTILDEIVDASEGDFHRAISLFAQRREADGKAIADLALRNFVEMRDKVADPKFLLRKKIAAWLHDRHPDFLPSYSMVTFTNTPYHIALQEDIRQDMFFDELVRHMDVDQVWDEAIVEQAFQNWQGASST